MRNLFDAGHLSKSMKILVISHDLTRILFCIFCNFLITCIGTHIYKGIEFLITCIGTHIYKRIEFLITCIGTHILKTNKCKHFSFGHKKYKFLNNIYRSIDRLIDRLMVCFKWICKIHKYFIISVVFMILQDFFPSDIFGSFRNLNLIKILE